MSKVGRSYGGEGEGREGEAARFKQPVDAPERLTMTIDTIPGRQIGGGAPPGDHGVGRAKGALSGSPRGRARQNEVGGGPTVRSFPLFSSRGSQRVEVVEHVGWCEQSGLLKALALQRVFGRPLQEQLDSRTMLAHHAKPAAPECSAAHERHESRVPGRAPSDEAEGGSGRRRSSMARQGQGLVSSLHSDEFTGRHLRPLLPGDYYLHAP